MESTRTALGHLNDCVGKMARILGDPKARLVVSGGTDTTLNVDLLLRAGKQKTRILMFHASDPVGRAEELEFWISIRDALQHLVDSSAKN